MPHFLRATQTHTMNCSFADVYEDFWIELGFDLNERARLRGYAIYLCRRGTPEELDAFETMACDLVEQHRAVQTNQRLARMTSRHHARILRQQPHRELPGGGRQQPDEN